MNYIDVNTLEKRAKIWDLTKEILKRNFRAVEKPTSTTEADGQAGICSKLDFVKSQGAVI